MLIAGVVDDQLDHHLHVAFVGGIEERLEIVQRAIGRIDVGVVRDVISVIAQRRGKERQKPDACDTQILQIVEPRHQAREIADAIIVGIGERPHVKLIDDCVFVPERIGGAGELLQNPVLRASWMQMSSIGQPDGPVSGPANNAEDVRRLHARLQGNIVTRTIPRVAWAVEQVFHHKALRGAAIPGSPDRGPSIPIARCRDRG